MARPQVPRPLPTRDGVSPSCVVLPAGPWLSVLAFLCERFPMVTQAEWRARMAAGEVVAADGEVITPQSRARSNLRVFYYRSLPAEPALPFAEQVLFQDELLVVVDKPHFMPVTPSGPYLNETLLVRLKRKLGIDTLNPIHRIDRETAGLVVFAVQPATRAAYHALFEQRVVTKHYEAVAAHRPELALPCVRESRIEEDPERFIRMQEVAGEANSRTHIELIEAQGGLARYGLQPVSGRRHQLRVHCAALGIPLLFDRIYPELMPENTDDHARPLQLLARRIAFRDPISGEARVFESQRRLLALDDAAALRGADAQAEEVLQHAFGGQHGAVGEQEEGHQK